MTESIKRGGRYIIYGTLFFLAFMFFAYMTFPYTLVNQNITDTVSRETGIDLRINELSPSFPLGFNAMGVSLTSPDGSRQLELTSISVDFSVWRLLIGQLAIKLEVVDSSNGVFDGLSTWSIFDLLWGGSAVPSHIGVYADRFKLNQIVGLGLKLYADQANDLIKGTLQQIQLHAFLDGSASINLARFDAEQSSGNVDLKLSDAKLTINDPLLKIEPQVFKKASLKAQLVEGKLVISKSSGFHSQEFESDFSGSANLTNPIPDSKMSMSFAVRLGGSLKENFGFLLSVVGGEDGALSYSLGGTIGSPRLRKI